MLTIKELDLEYRKLKSFITRTEDYYNRVKTAQSKTNPTNGIKMSFAKEDEK